MTMAVHTLSNSGLMAVTRDEYAAAALCFQRALEFEAAKDKSNAVPSSESITVTAAVNRALCWLYSGHLAKGAHVESCIIYGRTKNLAAIKSLENILKTDRVGNLNTTLVTNLAALYDLAGREVPYLLSQVGVCL